MTTHRAMALDAAAVALVSAAIALASHRLLFMTLWVPLVLLLRMLLWARMPPEDRTHSVTSEWLFFAGCTLLGGFNDWNSVVHHQIYDYTVPHYFPSFSSIPIWMLLFWGMVLRSLASLASWVGLGPSGPRDQLGPWKSGTAKVVFLLILVLCTRQLIYRTYLHEVASWLPFALALLVAAACCGVDAHERRLMLLMATGGPLIEVLYIHVGGLHSYHLGWLMGVPLWIALWWVLGIWVWKEVSGRVLRSLPPPHVRHASPST